MELRPEDARLRAYAAQANEDERDARKSLSSEGVYAAHREAVGMNRARGIVLLAAGALALWKGWMIHRGQMAMVAYALGVLALALSIWHLTRKAPAKRV